MLLKICLNSSPLDAETKQSEIVLFERE